MHVFSDYTNIKNIKKIVFAGVFNNQITVEDIHLLLSYFTELKEVTFDTDCAFYYLNKYYLNQNNDDKLEQFTSMHNKTIDINGLIKEDLKLNMIKAFSTHSGIQKLNFYSYILEDDTIIEISKIKNLIHLNIDLYMAENNDNINVSTQKILIGPTGGSALSQMNLKTLKLNYASIFNDSLTGAERIDILKYITTVNTLETLHLVGVFECSEFIFEGETSSDLLLKALHRMKNLKNLILEATDEDTPILKDFIFQLDKMEGLKNLTIDGAYLSHQAIAKIKELEKTKNINFEIKNIRTKHPHPGNRLCFFKDWTSSNQIESDLFLKATLHGIQNFNLEKIWINKWSHGFAKTINYIQNQKEENNNNL